MENENLPLAEDIGVSADEINQNTGLADLGTEPEATEGEVKAATPEPRPVPEKPNDLVPVATYLEERKARQNMERMLQQLLSQQQQANQPKAPDIPDIFENPDARIDHRTLQHTNPIREQLNYNSKLIAKAVLGAEKVDAAEQAFNEAAANGTIDPATYHRVQTAPNPWEAATIWHQQQRVLAETGGDLSAYEQKLLSNPDFLKRAAEAYAKQAPQTPKTAQPIVQVPSLSRTERGDAPLSKEAFRAQLRG